MSNTGAYQIHWTVPGGAQVQLAENGQEIYAGGDSATTVTGRPAGDYSYALAVDGVPGPTCSVAVRPPSLVLAFSLFAVGFVVFAFTLAFIRRGDRASADREES